MSATGLRTYTSAADQCWRLAGEIVARLRKTNDSWDDYYGQPPRLSEEDYETCVDEVASALWKRTGFRGELDFTLRPSALDAIGHG